MVGSRDQNKITEAVNELNHIAKTQDINQSLKELPDWTFDNNRISKTFKFKSFKEALRFIVRVGLHAEEQKHHPEISNVYNRVTLILSTHEAGDTVTQKDIELARTIEQFTWVYQVTANRPASHICTS